MGDLAFIVAGACALAAVALILVRLGNVRGNADWIYAWVALLAAGADLILIPATSWLNLLSPAYDHLFATFLLSGTLRFAALERYLPRLWAISIGLCLLRVIVQPFLPAITGALTATLIIGLCSSLSCWIVFKYAQRNSLTGARAMSLAFLAPAGIQVYFLVSRLQAEVISSALFAYVLMSSMLAMAQLSLLLERARRETERDRETLALMAQTAPVGLCLTDQEGHLEAINPVAQQVLGIGSNTDQRLTDILANHNSSLNLTEQPAFAMQIHGKVIQVQRQRIPVANQHAGDIWFLEDISARVQLSELIPKAANLETVKNIAANIAHVFNNKLLVISGNTELLALNFRSQAKREMSEYLEPLQDAVNDCSKITEDFLLLTQEEPVELSPLDLRAAIDNLNKSVEIDVVDEVEPLTLYVDATAFSRAFRELLANAQEAGASQVIIGSESTEDGLARLAIRDNGHGIDQDVTDRVFEPFFSTKDQPLGSGLGLSVVDSIVRAHGGTTQVHARSNGVEILMTWPTMPHLGPGKT